MTTPIVLWKSKAKEECDDAGISIRKTILAPSVSKRFPYESITQAPPRRTGRGVPPLSYFCINALVDYSEQLHVLGSSRLHLRKETGRKKLLQLLLPNWKTPSFSFLNVDPRIWAAIVQIYSNTPSILETYPIDLSDPHLPLQQQIPSTSDFTLITILDLQRSKHLTDDNIIVLKSLYNLCALDISNTCISSYAIKVLSRALDSGEDGEPKGPWGLRVLRMQECWSVSSSIMDYLISFPLLCVVDLRRTRCNFRDVKRPFRVAEHQRPLKQPMQDMLEALNDMHLGFWPSNRPRALFVQQDLVPEEPSAPQNTSTSHRSMHNSFVVLAPSEGTSRFGEPLRVQTGNVDEMEERQRRAEVEKRRRDYEVRSGMREGMSWDEEENCWKYEVDDISWNGISDPCWDDASDDPMSDSGDEYSNYSVVDQELSSRRRSLEPHSFEDSLDGTSFYKQRPRKSPVRSSVGSTDRELILCREPAPWSALPSIQRATRQSLETRPKTTSKETGDVIQLRGRAKEKCSLQAWHTNLAKRRKTAIPEFDLQDEDFDVSMPPSPTSTLCEMEPLVADLSVIRQVSPTPVRRPVIPIANIPRPRLKLDPRELNQRSTPKENTNKFGTPLASEKSSLSLKSAFKAQARKFKEVKSPGAEGGIIIKGPKEIGANRTLHDRKENNRATKNTPVSTKKSFDWGRWSTT